ncbi:MAG: MMPL family transporter [Kineosporiaceae bacterium]
MTALSSLAGSLRLAAVVVVAALAAVVVVLLLPTPDPAEPRSGTGLSDSYESVRAERLEAQLPSVDVDTALVVISREDGAALTEADLAAAADATAVLADLAVGGTVPPPQPAPDGTVALLPLPLTDDGNDPEATTELVAEVRAGLDDLPSGLRAEVTGGPAFAADLSAVFDGADVTLLLVTAAVVAVLLLVTYRSPILVVVPLVVVAAAEQTVLRLLDIVLPGAGLADDGSTPGIVSILVFGAATNYALLLIARYREQLRVTERPADAMREAVRRAGAAILASGGTVVLAVAALLLAQTEGFQALGLGSMIGIIVAMITGLVVLPCALVLFGRVAFWPFVPRYGSTGREGALWGRVGSVAARRPALVAGGGLLALVALAAPALGIQTGLSQNEQFRETPEAVSAAETLASAFPAGATEPAEVLTTPAAAPEVAVALADVEGVVSAEVGEAGDAVARVDVVVAAEPGSEESFDVLREVRETAAAVGGDATVVGGPLGERLDLADAQARDRVVVVPLILVLVGAVLVVLLRALVASALLLVTVVASYFASLGASWLLFQGVFDYPALDAPVLLLSFVFLVALGVDYSIFLTTRAREEAATAGTGPGMLTALRVTGGVITSAGVLLAAVFAVLGVLPLITLTQIGVIVCVGVLLDTLVVRTLVVPSLAFLLRERFWWPARVDPRTSTGAGAGAGAGAGDPVGAPEAVSTAP